MERLTTDNPRGNVESALNLFYIKDGETWVRGGGPAPDYQDVRLYDYICEVVETLKADIDAGLSDDDLGECLYELLCDGNSTMEGITATLYMAAWAFSMLRAKLKDYEDTGPVTEFRALQAAEQKRREGCEFCCATYEKEDWKSGGGHDFRLDRGVLYYYDEQFGWEGIKVNACPMCGKPYEEEARHEV